MLMISDTKIKGARSVPSYISFQCVYVGYLCIHLKIIKLQRYIYNIHKIRKCIYPSKREWIEIN